ncbi:MAG: rhodanese-like domain-containing protein [Pseudomonadota bacterium]
MSASWLLEVSTSPDSQHYEAVLNDSTAVVLFSAFGKRSALAGAALRRLGHEDVEHIEGKLDEWIDRGGDVELRSDHFRT